MVAGVLIAAPALAAQDDARGKWQVSTSGSRGAADFRIALETRGDRSIQAACGSADPRAWSAMIGRTQTPSQYSSAVSR